MFLENLVVGPLECNCIIFGCKKTEEAVVIDPGDEATRIVNCLNQSGLHLKYILQTHAHVDHISAAKDLQEATQTEVLLHRDDLLLLDSLQMQAFMFGLEIKPPPKINRFLKEDDIIAVGAYEMRVIHSPGHSPGSVAFYMCFVNGDEKHILFAGDTIFYRGIGRYDLPGGSYEQLMTSIRDKLFVLPDDTIVYPGHGPMTTIEEEKQYNLY
ncbi:TPA: MBL fold metallo-hydrolase [Candidatus Poribacteria bacterium]|nr:MBL fold metallo-hydrolase [Candidatus Poribacteria bacterium]